MGDKGAFLAGKDGKEKIADKLARLESGTTEEREEAKKMRATLKKKQCLNMKKFGKCRNKDCLYKCELPPPTQQTPSAEAAGNGGGGGG